MRAGDERFRTLRAFAMSARLSGNETSQHEYNGDGEAGSLQ
jgi:hypothetical protein